MVVNFAKVLVGTTVALPLSAGRNVSPSLDFCLSDFKAEHWSVVRLSAVLSFLGVKVFRMLTTS